MVAVHVDEHTATGTLDNGREPDTDLGGDRFDLLDRQALVTQTGVLGDERCSCAISVSIKVEFMLPPRNVERRVRLLAPRRCVTE